MSRVGLKPIKVPTGVTVSLNGATVTAKGPKGTIEKDLPTLCDIAQEGDTILVTRPAETRTHREMHGLTRTLLNNMILGVSEGFVRDLEIVGVGYRAEVKGRDLVMNLGFSHPIIYTMPEGITIEAPELTKVKVSGIEKDKVGQVASEIRRFRPPEPYKGKGIKYAGEIIQRKAGKTAASGS